MTFPGTARTRYRRTRLFAAASLVPIAAASVLAHAVRTQSDGHDPYSESVSLLDDFASKYDAAFERSDVVAFDTIEDICASGLLGDDPSYRSALYFHVTDSGYSIDTFVRDVGRLTFAVQNTGICDQAAQS